GGPGCFDGVRLLDRNGWRDATDVVHARFVHAVEELPHVRRKGVDVTALAFGVNCLKGQTRFAAAARTGDDRQFPQRKIDVDALEIILPRSANFDAIMRVRHSSTRYLHNLRTHWKQFQIAGRFATYSRFAVRSARWPVNPACVTSPTGRRLQ